MKNHITIALLLCACAVVPMLQSATIRVHNATNASITVHETTLAPNEERGDISVSDCYFKVVTPNETCFFTTYDKQRHSVKYEQDLIVNTSAGTQRCAATPPQECLYGHRKTVKHHRK